MRRFGAICIALNLRTAIRWPPSEFNIADAPSRTAYQFTRQPLAVTSPV